MDHDRTRLLTESLLLPCIRSLGLLAVAHLHILVAVALFLFLLGIFVLAATALGFEVLAAGIGVFFVFLFGASSVVPAGPLHVFALFCFGGGQFGFEAFFELDFFGAVVGAVVFDNVGFRLLGWEFGRG